MKAPMTAGSLFHVLFTALCILLVPATSEAVSTTINNVTVTVGGVTWCITGCSTSPTGNSGAGAIWSTAAGTVITSPDSPGNHTLILTQTPNIGGNGNVFNFDTSDRDGTAIGTCSSSLPCSTVLSINGTSIPLSGGQAN